MERKRNTDFISPMDVLLSEEEVEETPEPEVSPKTKEHYRQKNAPSSTPPPPPVNAKRQEAVFISATDTGIGKTITTAVLGILLKSKQVDVGVMKPVQCAGDDAAFLKNVLQAPEPLTAINPCHTAEPLSPHLAFARQKSAVDIRKIKENFEMIRKQHDWTLVEGAGGLLVPLTEHYDVADLVKQLGLELIIVARLGLGTINHTLLTIREARRRGIPIKGIIFNQPQKGTSSLAEETNPAEIARLGKVPILGTISFFEKVDAESFAAEVLKHNKPLLDLSAFLENPEDKKSGEIVEWDKKFVWHPFTQMKDWQQEKPLVIQRAYGSYLEDTEGQKYLDGVSSLWVNVHGHAKRFINDELVEQLGRLDHSTMLGLSNVEAVLLAKKLIEIAPTGLQKVFYSDNGSTSVEVAIKMSYQYWQNTGRKGKIHIAHLTNAYHGDTLGSVSVGGIDLFHKVYHNLTFKTISIEFPDFYRAPKGKDYPQYTEECLGKMEELFRRRHNEIASLVVEPLVQGAAGMIVWPEGVLKRIAELCRKYDILLIADEVATGFGRTGKMFASEHEGVVPDFLCLAKGLTGGYLPLAATLTTQKVYDGFLFDYAQQKAFFHGHTYTGNPLACRAALANLALFERDEILRKMPAKVDYLAKALKRFEELPSVGQVRQKGFMVGIELVKNKEQKIPFPWQDKIGVRVCQLVRSRGVILRPLGNVIVLMPPLAIAKSEMDHLLETTYWAICEVTATNSQPNNRRRFRPRGGRRNSGRRSGSRGRAPATNRAPGRAPTA